MLIRTAMCLLAGLFLALSGDAWAQDKKTETRDVVIAPDSPVAKGVFPADWKDEKPSNNLRAMQFRVPAAEGSDTAEGYVSVMRAGGSLDDNKKRWLARFKEPKGGEVTTVERDGLKISSLELSGTYLQRPFPMSPEVKEKPDYKMLVAVVETSENTAYILLTGPAKTIDGAKSGWEAFLKSLKK